MHGYPSLKILPTWGRNQVSSSPRNAWLFLSTNPSPQSRKESSLFPPEMHSYHSPHREGVMLASLKCILLQLLPKIQHYPSPQILSHLYVGKDSSPFKMQNPYKSFPTKYFLYFFLLVPPILFPNLGILPQSGKIIPQHLGRIIEE